MHINQRGLDRRVLVNEAGARSLIRRAHITEAWNSTTGAAHQRGGDRRLRCDEAGIDACIRSTEAWKWRGLLLLDRDQVSKLQALSNSLRSPWLLGNGPCWRSLYWETVGKHFPLVVGLFCLVIDRQVRCRRCGYNECSRFWQELLEDPFVVLCIDFSGVVWTHAEVGRLFFVFWLLLWWQGGQNLVDEPVSSTLHLGWDSGFTELILGFYSYGFCALYFFFT